MSAIPERGGLFRLLRPAPLLRARPMSRDKSDTLLLLAACSLVLAPHAVHLPWWTVLTCGLLLAWRGWITFRGTRMPHRWILLPLALLAMAGVYLSNQTFFGREAGVMMLVLLLTFKLLEMHARRDLFVVVFLGMFLILTNLFYSQSIPTALLMVAAVIAMLTAQLSFQYTGAAPPLAKRLKLGASIFALALPLTFILFLLFPRIQGPLWGMPIHSQSSRSGLSDNMSPGNISKLALSSEIAFRVRFQDPPPPNAALYWRGPVLGAFDGRTWTPVPPRASLPVNIRYHGNPIRYQVTLEPTGNRSLFALETPLSSPVVAGNQTRIAPDLQLLARQPITERVRYEATSHIAFDLQADAAADSMEQWLALPPGYNPRTRALAERLRDETGGGPALVNTVLRHFRTQGFSYTLEPPLLGAHTADDFLFGTRAGFCEHYSSAFVVLMRAAGIPARVVTGYQGGEINPVDGFMTVRQSDAHAWAEVWFERRGWVRVDPTAAVAPDRVQRNLASVIPSDLLGGLVTLPAEGNLVGSLLKSVRQNWDAVNNGWNQWVLDYGPARQRGLLESLGLRNADWPMLAALMLGIGMGVTALILIPLLRNRPTVDPVEQLYQRLCRLLAARGLPRLAHEGPRTYRQRLAEAPLPADLRGAAIRFLELYENLRYAPPADARDSSSRPSVATVSRLKSLLAECR